MGHQAHYSQAAVSLGKLLAESKLTLVYGGGNVGLMGTIAQTVMDEGGEVIGVIPEQLFKKEVALTTITQLHVVSSMHERKAMMASLSDAFIALPGGLGTFEEIFEMITWSQLSIHQKPCAFINIEGYYDHLMQFLDHSVDQGFVAAPFRDMILSAADPQTLLNTIQTYQHPIIDKAQLALTQN